MLCLKSIFAGTDSQVGIGGNQVVRAGGRVAEDGDLLDPAVGVGRIEQGGATGKFADVIGRQDFLPEIPNRIRIIFARPDQLHHLHI